MSARRIVMCMTCHVTQGWSFEDWNAPEADSTIDRWLTEHRWLTLPTNDRRNAPVHVCADCATEIRASLLTLLLAIAEAEDGSDQDFDRALDAVMARARELAGKPAREGVSEKTEKLPDTLPAPAGESES